VRTFRRWSLDSHLGLPEQFDLDLGSAIACTSYRGQVPRRPWAMPPARHYSSLEAVAVEAQAASIQHHELTFVFLPIFKLRVASVKDHLAAQLKQLLIIKQSLNSKGEPLPYRQEAIRVAFVDKGCTHLPQSNDSRASLAAQIDPHPNSIPIDLRDTTLNVIAYIYVAT